MSLFKPTAAAQVIGLLSPSADGTVRNYLVKVHPGVTEKITRCGVDFDDAKTTDMSRSFGGSD